MKDSPILFSGPMVKAILEGRKTQTRRVIRPQPRRGNEFGFNPIVGMWCEFDPRQQEIINKQNCPYGFPGDRLWVKESLVSVQDSEGSKPLALYNAGRAPVLRGGQPAEWQWKRSALPSMFMPRWASRFILPVTAIRAERLQAISEADAIAEGVTLPPHTVTMYDGIYRHAYAALWDELNAKRGLGWATNPWVWVIEFRKV